MRKLVLLLLLAFSALADEKTVSLYHFSDYHSHALPFYTDDGERGGIARAIGYLKRQHGRGALVFSGGDTINKGAPAWSDTWQCAEWAWWNGVVDAMAFGNHDADYGYDAFDRCRKSTRYPILSANTAGMRPYQVFTRNGLRIGVFALAGSDFAQLVKVPRLTFNEPVAAARETVRALREKEMVDAVVMIGHQHTEDDYALAKAVPGIDLIFGSHSHLKRELVQIPGTRTWFIAPSQYLTYISWVELQFADGKLGAIDGALVPVDARMPEDRVIATRVARMQQELERDHPELFTSIGTLPAPLSVAALAQRALDTMRQATNTSIAISTTSSFRRPLPAGILTMELLRAAMPYDNEIVVCTITGADLQRLQPESFLSSSEPIDSTRTYKAAMTDYLWGREKFDCERTGFKVRAELQKGFYGVR
ncbi:MAG TPA: 5'-nucleotidase C-terminal domain-containing protein [Thermoanaerobaculia bacterium]|nr:5'-nucleotidase C-terminal domain-containing protein [Thermoanaerobaculia bacterium]